MARGVFLKKNGEKYYPAPYMPIGSIYLTVSNDNPSKWFGGTWEKMSGGYLYACVNNIGNSSYTGTNTQGHTLTEQQIPSHSHTMREAGNHSHGVNFDQVWAWGGTTSLATTAGGPYGGSGYIRDAGSHSHTINNTGGGQAHSHNIAYIGVWCWKRIA